jgi:hypothetical protein
MKRIVIALQFCHSDKENAMRVARLIADNEPSFRKDVEICFVARFDCVQDLETIGYVASKFVVSTFTTTTKATGWPQGPNAMAFDMIKESWRRVFFAMAWADVKFVLLMEPDCIPVRSDWINLLIETWDTAHLQGKYIVGCWRDGGGTIGHINGNMMFPPNLTARINTDFQIDGCAWDCQMAPAFSPHWYHTDRIVNLWQEKNISEERLNKMEYAALVHGCKSDDVYDYAKKKLGLK